MSRFFRNPDTGRIVIAQWPNLPLWIYLGAVVVRTMFSPEGRVDTVVSAVGAVGLAWWAIDEVLRGESPFRRVLGGVVLAMLVVGLAGRVL